MLIFPPGMVHLYLHTPALHTEIDGRLLLVVFHSRYGLLASGHCVPASIRGCTASRVPQGRWCLRSTRSFLGLVSESCASSRPTRSNNVAGTTLSPVLRIRAILSSLSQLRTSHGPIRDAKSVARSTTATPAAIKQRSKTSADHRSDAR